MTFYTVKPENEPTEEQAREHASNQWSRFMANYGHPESGRETWVEATWKGNMEDLREKRGDPMATAEYTDRLPSEDGTVIAVPDFLSGIADGAWHGGGLLPMRDGMVARDVVLTGATAHLIPLDATHILKLNRWTCKRFDGSSQRKSE
jgi:hypothetical protein